MSETFAEAVERLRRETRLSEQIEELARHLTAARSSSGLGYIFSGPQLAVLVDQLRELRGRRVAMQREPDDEVNASADALELTEAYGLKPMVLDLPLLPDGPGEHGEPAWARGAAMPGDRCGPRLRCGLWLSGACPVADIFDGQVDCLACEPLSEEPKPECTGVAASWCPVHGECTCAHDYDLNEPDCPLHGTGSDHAEAPPDPEAIAQRLMGELGPDLAVAVCVQLLGRLQWRKP